MAAFFIQVRPLEVLHTPFLKAIMPALFSMCFTKYLFFEQIRNLLILSNIFQTRFTHLSDFTIILMKLCVDLGFVPSALMTLEEILNPLCKCTFPFQDPSRASRALLKITFSFPALSFCVTEL